MIRRVLPARRNCITFDVRHGGRVIPVTIGCYEDWSIGEVFIGAHKKGGSEADVAAMDCGIMLSLAVQFGTPLQTIFAASTKTETGEPEGLAGTVLKVVIEQEKRMRESK